MATRHTAVVDLNHLSKENNVHNTYLIISKNQPKEPNIGVSTTAMKIFTMQNFAISSF